MCYSPWGRKVSDTTEQLNSADLFIPEKSKTKLKHIKLKQKDYIQLCLESNVGGRKMKSVWF